MSVDARGFVYPLEALQRQAAWRLEALRIELGAALRALSTLQEETGGLQREHDTLARAAAPPALGGVDPVRARSTLAFLSDARRRLQLLDLRVTDAQAEVERLREGIREQQHKLDSIERHRGERLRDHISERGRRLAVEADQDWLTRSASQRARQEGGQ